MDKFMKFLETVQNDPAAKEQLKDIQNPKSGLDVVEGYSKIAKALGYDLTKKDIAEGLQNFVKEQQARTAKAESEVEKAVLSEENLENIAGGKFEGICASSYEPNEWCWFSDSCSVVINGYEEKTVPTDNCKEALLNDGTYAEFWDKGTGEDW